mgnify:FL=1|jgi:hypothetical protein
MDNLMILLVITALVVVASYVLSISWQDFTRHIIPAKLRTSKSKE